MEHEVKILATYASLHFKGLKPWEKRRNDRNYKVNDTLNFTIVSDDTLEPLGMTYRRTISYVSKEAKYGLKEGYCILTLK